MSRSFDSTTRAHHHLQGQTVLSDFPLLSCSSSSLYSTIYNAIKVGYRLFDGACDYGNEKECGDGVARALRDGLVKREDLCSFHLSFSFSLRSLPFPSLCSPEESPAPSSSHHLETMEHLPREGARPSHDQEAAQRLGTRVL